MNADLTFIESLWDVLEGTLLDSWIVCQYLILTKLMQRRVK